MTGFFNNLWTIDFFLMKNYQQKIKPQIVDILALADELPQEERTSTLLFHIRSLGKKKIKPNLKGQIRGRIFKARLMGYAQMAKVDFPTGRKDLFIPALLAIHMAQHPEPPKIYRGVKKMDFLF